MQKKYISVQITFNAKKLETEIAEILENVDELYLGKRELVSITKTGKSWLRGNISMLIIWKQN